MSEKDGIEESEGTREKIREFRNDPIIILVEDLLISVAIVGGIAVVLYGISGIWPPMVAVESGSMEPNIQQGDIVFVVSPTNFIPEGVETKHGIVTHEMGEDEGYRRFGDYGDPIVFHPDGSSQRTPIIHRAMFYVEEGETWTDTEGETHTAPHDGFVTKGDNNDEFDQAQGLSAVVKPEWVVGKARYRVPVIGRLRLLFPSTGFVTDETFRGGMVSVGKTPGPGTGAGTVYSAS